MSPSPVNHAKNDVVFHARGLRKIYDMGEVKVHALRGIDLDLFASELVVLLGASLSMGGILRVRWTTQIAPCAAREAIIHAINMRDDKTRVFGRSLALLIVGLCLYIGSVALLLLGNVPR